MSVDELNTLQSIHLAGKKEFLMKDFQSASLRNIVKNAGVTTGAFYGYYKTKEDLFDALVCEAAKSFLDLFRAELGDFESLSPNEQINYLSERSMDMRKIVHCIYQDADAFKLIIYKSKGTRYEEFIHEVMKHELEGTHRFVELARSNGYDIQEVPQELEHIIFSSFFNGLFELVAHDAPMEVALKYAPILQDFFMAGWLKIAGL